MYFPGQIRLLLQCSWETLDTFSRNDPRLQGTAGAIAVLHTHSRRLDYHPHVHLAVPAAAVDAKHRQWRTKTGSGRKRYLFSHKPLAKVFRAKFLTGLTQAGLPVPIPAFLRPRPALSCPCCGGTMKILRTRISPHEGYTRVQDAVAGVTGM